MEVGSLVLVHEISIGPWRFLGLVRHIYIVSWPNFLCRDLQESKRQKREKREGGRISSGFVKADLEGQTDPDRADILWEASSVSGLKVHRRDLYFNGWIFCCLGFSEASRHSSSAVLSWVFGKSDGWIFSDWAEIWQRCCWLVHLGFVRWD